MNIIWAKITLFIAILLSSHTQVVIPVPPIATTTPSVVHIKERISAPVQASGVPAGLIDPVATSTETVPTSTPSVDQEGQNTPQTVEIVIPEPQITVPNPDPTNSYEAESAGTADYQINNQ